MWLTILNKILIMSSAQMLEGIELIDCAKANAKQGIKVAAKQCGYGDDLNLFKNNLIKSCQGIGVDIKELEDLITDQQLAKEQQKIEISPETPTEL
ncbi:hypothetical protein STA3757_10330 [Stanieria sp. NIES-3757]|nr:hypothetical protein STA3757_10330 [Stanieria sp. NIES-3757]